MNVIANCNLRFRYLRVSRLSTGYKTTNNVLLIYFEVKTYASELDQFVNTREFQN